MPWNLVGATQWSWWWEFNRHRYLNLKARVHAAESESGGDDFFLGIGEYERGETLRPPRRLVLSAVLPRLVEVLERENNPDLVTAALVAVAKIGHEPEDPEGVRLERVIAPFLRNPSQEIAETAAISLAILGHEPSAPLLADLLHDNAGGRLAVGASQVSDRTRAFAAYGLGLLGRRSAREDVQRFAVHHLVRALEEDRTASADLSCACAIALGLVPLERWDPERGERDLEQPPSACREALIAYLVEVLGDEQRHDWVRAHAGTSLGRLGGLPSSAGDLREGVVRVLLGAIRPTSREPDQLVRACVLALGPLADADGDVLDREIRTSLAAARRGFGDQAVRNFSLISLALIGARVDGDEGDLAGRDQILTQLLGELGRGKHQQRPWAGLALGVYARGLSGRQVAAEPALGEALSFAVVEERRPELLAACCVGTGLTRDGDGAALVRQRLAELDEDWTRGHAAVALGLAGDLDALELLNELLRESRYRPELLSKSAIALGVLGDKQAVPALISMLREAQALSSQASIAAALGHIGDARSIDSLLSMLDDESRTATARAFAVVALGTVCDRRDLPWNEPIATGVQYLAAPATLFDQVGRGVLNIL